MNKDIWGFSAPLSVKKYDNWIIFLLSFLYIRWDLLWNGTGISVLIFTILFCGFVYLRLDLDNRISPENRKASLPWFLVIALSAIASAWFDYTPLGWFNFLFLTAAVLYWLAVLTGTRILPEVSSYLPLDFLIQLVKLPFSNFDRFFSSIFRTRISCTISSGEDNSFNSDSADGNSTVLVKRRTLLRSGIQILLTLCMITPLLLIVLNLLAAADESFMRIIAHMIDDFFSIFTHTFSFNMIETIGHLLLAIPVSAYLFGLLWAHTHPDQAKGFGSKEITDRWLLALHCVPGIMILTALLAFTMIYLLFLGLQASHLLEALNHGLPETTTYSQFAREGFFELCTVAFINLMILIGVWLLSKRTVNFEVPRNLRLMLSLLSIQTILLVVTAMVKMGLYIQVYGLTRLRVYTFWFMIWLLLVFIILTLATARKRGIAAGTKLTPAKCLTVLTVSMFLALNYLNVDALIVRNHISRAEKESLSVESFDAGYLWSLSGNARLALVKHYGGDIPKEWIPHGYWDGGDWRRATLTSIRLNSQLKDQ